MKLQIELIKINDRIRLQPGDLTSLKESIEKVGLLNPVIVNEDYELVAGFRRVEACRQLGWTEIEATIIDTLSNAVKELDIEYHENLGRTDLTIAEMQKYIDKRERLVRPPKPRNVIWAWLKRLWEKIKSIFKSKKIDNEAEDEFGV